MFRRWIKIVKIEGKPHTKWVETRSGWRGFVNGSEVRDPVHESPGFRLFSMKKVLKSQNLCGEYRSRTGDLLHAMQAL